MTIIISVKVYPNAGCNQVVGQFDNVWKIKIAASPVRGKANKDLVDFLSRLSGLKKAQIIILRGHNSQRKIVQIEGLSEAELAGKLEAKE